MNQRKVEELESKIRELLPKTPTLEVNPEIQELTRELIKEGENVRFWEGIGKIGTEEVMRYTHSVCHLFERYGDGHSYLNLTAQLPDTEELVNYTLRKAMEAEEFDCVSRIIRPIINLNLAHLEENPESFTFRPEILTDPEFIEKFSSDEIIQYIPYLIDFCKSESIEEFFPKYVEALRKEEGLEENENANKVVPGIFIDVEGTLIRYDNQVKNFRRLASTQEYALRKMDEGIPVTVFTGADPESAVKKLKSAGIDERLYDVKHKREFIGRILETCVDDTAPGMQGFRARTHYESGEKAWNTEYSAEK